MTCTGGRLAACLEWQVDRPSPVMSDVLGLVRGRYGAVDDGIGKPRVRLHPTHC
jgi:hypothetical protein